MSISPLIQVITRNLHPFTLPQFITASPAFATLLPVTIGSAIGYSTCPPNKPNRAAEQYYSLRQPPLHPPAWLFGPVWTSLYAMMGYASYRVYTKGLSSAVPGVRIASQQGITLYSSSLLLNFMWMPLFFGLNLPRVALADIILLTANVGAAAGLFFKVDKVAGYMMVPYLGWLGFGTYICAGVGWLNGWDVRGKKKGPVSSKKKD